MKNAELAKILNQIAEILEYKNVKWKPRAYRNAANSIENLTEDIKIIMSRGELEKIPGIGEGIAKKIEEFLETGRIKLYDRLKKEVPKGISNLLEIQGLGPKYVKRLHKELGISTVAQLEKAVKSHKIREIEGFGERSEENLLKAITLFKRGHERMLLGKVWPIANNLVSYLKRIKDVEKVSLAGSILRMKETVGDIDILIVSENAENVMEKFISMEEVSQILATGKTKSSVILSSGIQIDLRVVDKKSWGSALQYFTGSKKHGVKVRKIAINKGYKLSEYGLFKRNKKIAGKTEEGIYKKLGFKQTPPPELRENLGEIEAAIKGTLPKLISYGDIKGDLHIHTNKSDGNETIREMALAAKKLGREYIAITDHSQRTKIANGLSEEEILNHIKEIKRIDKGIKDIKILSGSEVDILPDGSLDYSDKILKKLDIVNASVHSGLKTGKKEMTKRIISAIENKYVNIISHPTGRMIGKRSPYEVELNEVIVAAKENNVALEINSQPLRMDLKDILIKKAVESGAKLVISTDAHDSNQLKFMQFGIAQARRGWAKKKDIINTKSLKQVKRFFR